MGQLRLPAGSLLLFLFSVQFRSPCSKTVWRSQNCLSSSLTWGTLSNEKTFSFLIRFLIWFSVLDHGMTVVWVSVERDSGGGAGGGTWCNHEHCTTQYVQSMCTHDRITWTVHWWSWWANVSFPGHQSGRCYLPVSFGFCRWLLSHCSMLLSYWLRISPEQGVTKTLLKIQDILINVTLTLYGFWNDRWKAEKLAARSSKQFFSLFIDSFLFLPKQILNKQTDSDQDLHLNFISVSGFCDSSVEQSPPPPR